MQSLNIHYKVSNMFLRFLTLLFQHICVLFNREQGKKDLFVSTKDKEFFYKINFKIKIGKFRTPRSRYPGLDSHRDT